MREKKAGTRSYRNRPTTRGDGIERELQSIIESALAAMKECNLPPKKISENLVTAIFESFGGITVYIPMGHKWAKIRRNQELLTDWQNGMSINGLAQKYKLVTSSVYSLISELKSVTTERQQNQDSKDDVQAEKAD